MNRWIHSTSIVLIVVVVLAFTWGPVLAAEKPVDKSKQTPAKIDKAKTEPSKKKIQSKDVKGKTEKSGSQKTDKAMGEGVSKPVIPPVGGGPGPIGKSTNTTK